LAGQSDAGSQTLSYSGRITDNQGVPVSGSLDLTLKFFDAKAGGKQLGPSKVIPGATVNQGVFQVEIELSESEINSVFGTTGNVWIQVSTETAVFPRQSFNAVPYALRVPVSSSLKFNSQGELEVDTKNIDLTNNSSPIKISSESNNGSVILEASGSSDLTLKLPPDLGTANYVLKTDGAGNLSWAVDAVVAAGAVDSLAITNDAITDIDINSTANIAATKLADGLVDNTEFNTLNGVSSSIQTQLNGKATKGGDSGALTLGTNNANDLTLEANGSAVVTVKSGGNVGIATTGPLDTLSINGDVSLSATGGNWAKTFKGRGNAGSDFGGFGIHANNDTLTKYFIGPIWSAPHMSILPTGNVGIGTTGPSAQLEVKTTGGVAIKASAKDNSWPLWIDSVGGGFGGFYDPAGAGKGSWLYLSDGSDYNVKITPDGVSYFNGGNVGIGTTSPTRALDIVGTSSIRNHSDTGHGQIFFEKTKGTATLPTAVDAAGQGLGAISGSGWDGDSFEVGARISFATDGVPGDGDMPGMIGFRTTPNGSDTPIERMRVASTGNVGIGTTNPIAPLDIDGHIRSSPSPSGFGARYTGLDISQGAGTNRYLLLAQKGDNTHAINGEIVGRRQQNSGVGENSLRAYIQVITNSSAETHSYWRIDSQGATPTIVELTYGGNQWIALDAVNTATFSLLQHAQFTGQFSNQTDQLTWVDAPSVSGILPVTSSRNFTLAGKVGIGTSFPHSQLTIEGVTSLKEQASAPADVATYGKLYTKTDGKLYFKSDDTGEIDLTSGGSSTTGVNGSATLASDFSITAGNGVPQSTGLNVTLPSAGTYLVTADACGQITFSSGPYGQITADLYNTTAALQVADSETTIVLEQSSGTSDLGCASISKLVTVAVSTGIELRATRIGGTAWTVSNIKSNSIGKTRITYVKLSN
jgi:hypothetical protein